MFSLIDYFTVSLFLGGIIAFLSGFFIFLVNKRNILNISWLFFNISSAVWSFGYLLMITASSEKSAYFSDLVLHIAALFVPFFFFVFVTTITKTYLEYRKLIWLFIFPIALFFVSISNSSLFIDGVYQKFIFNYAPNAGPLYILFALYFVFLTLASFYVLLNKIFFLRKEKDKKELLQLNHIFISSLIGFIGGGSVFFITFNVNFPPYPIILFALFPLVVVRAIVKYNLFNIKVIATQLFVFIQVSILLIRATLSVSLTDKIINYGLLISMAFVGYLLIKSVQKEVDSKEEIEKLAEGLEQANDQLKLIDSRKSDFINIASHQLRTPATAIKGYTSLMIEGSYGEMDGKIKEMITRINGLADQSVKIVADMLNISRIEQNRMKYTFEKVNLTDFVMEIIKNLKLKADAKKLPYGYSFDKKLMDSLDTERKVYAFVDKTLLAQVFENVIDNSVKYTQQGSVKIDMKMEDNTFIFTCIDTGIGIDKGSIETLFKKFGRAKNAQDSGIEGTGIGLYIAKEIMEKHHGSIKIESDGPGKGSKSTVTMDLSKAPEVEENIEKKNITD